MRVLQRLSEKSICVFVTRIRLNDWSRWLRRTSIHIFLSWELWEFRRIIEESKEQQERQEVRYFSICRQNRANEITIVRNRWEMSWWWMNFHCKDFLTVKMGVIECSVTSMARHTDTTLQYCQERNKLPLIYSLLLTQADLQMFLGKSVCLVAWEVVVSRILISCLNLVVVMFSREMMENFLIPTSRIACWSCFNCLFQQSLYSLVTTLRLFHLTNINSVIFFSRRVLLRFITVVSF
jgi:hypothetical protein